MMNESRRTHATHTNFQKFELVWAKIMGWPWWPGRITQIPENSTGNYRVDFIADPSQYLSPLT